MAKIDEEARGGGTSIAQRVLDCLESYRSVDKDLVTAGPHIKIKMPSDGLRDEFGRFRVWSGNVGSHKKGRCSLDYKLREASHIRERVIELLQNKFLVLGEIRAIVVGERVSWEDLSDCDSAESTSETGDDDDPSTTELKQLLSNVADINTCLMRLSMSIRNPAPHDQFKGSKNIDFTSYELFDMDHVQNKFPQAPEFLRVRLGKAISRRHQYLRYRDEHRKIYGQGLDAPADDRTGPAVEDKDVLKPHIPATTVTSSRNAQSTVASSIPMNIKATTSISELQTLNCGEDAFSETSYASSSNLQTTRRPPPLPEQGERGEPFECQLCFRITSVKHVGEWHKHVYQDLQPYVSAHPSAS